MYIVFWECTLYIMQLIAMHLHGCSICRCAALYQQCNTASIDRMRACVLRLWPAVSNKMQLLLCPVCFECNFLFPSFGEYQPVNVCMSLAPFSNEIATLLIQNALPICIWYELFVFGHTLHAITREAMIKFDWRRWERRMENKIKMNGCFVDPKIALLYIIENAAQHCLMKF